MCDLSKREIMYKNKPDLDPKLGEIWAINHIPEGKPEKEKDRPFIVLSNKLPYNRYYLAPMTRSAPHPEDQDYVLEIKKGEKGWPSTGLYDTSYALFYNILPFSYSKGIFIRRMGVYHHRNKLEAMLRMCFSLQH